MRPEMCYRLADQVAPGVPMHVSHFDQRILFNIPCHTHDYHEFFLLSEGEMLHGLNGEKRLVRQGTLAFICPEDVHSFGDTGKAAYFVNIVMRPEALEALRARLGGGSEALPEGEGKLMQLSPAAAQCVLDAALRLSSFGEADPASQRLMMLALSHAILSAQLNRPDADMPRWLAQVVRAYQSPGCFAQPVQALYERCGYSKEHVCRSFRKYLGVTPTAFLNDLRLAHARELLLSTRMNVLEISMVSGFDSLSHFNHLFRKKYGMTPTQCRGR